ncbi:MAG: alpha/beta hydrolase [Candidatus Eremiobacteraeota bacterium]|nr:alpha/beta hydrolase [Candidatus Eremiobacteraeota bacterium]
MPRALRLLANGAPLALAALALALAMWTVVPAPSLPILVLAVAVPEAAPWAVAGCIAVALVAYALARGRARIASLAFAAAACACALVPLLEFPLARANAERELDAQLGTQRIGPSPAAQNVTVVNDLAVVTRDGTRLGLDLYRPPGKGERPTIVTIYGGAWIFGNRAATADIDRHYAALGYTAIAIDYRHAPAFVFPTQLHDVQDALATIAAHARAWGVDPRRVALFGRSAGAELALLAAYAPEPLTIRAAVGYYTPADLRRGYDDPPEPDPANVRKILRTYIGSSPEHAAAAYAAASPLAEVRPGLMPTFLIGGERDALVRIAFQRELRDALRAHGDEVVSIELPWSNHVFDEIPGGLGASIATPATERFIAKTLGVR